MRRLLYAVSVVSLIAVSCKEKPETEETNPDAKPQTAPQMQFDKIDASAYSTWKEKHLVSKDCTPEVCDLSERRHNVDSLEFEKWARAHAENPDQRERPTDPLGKNLVWDCTKSLPEILEILKSKKIECYNGWLRLKMDENNLVIFERADTFDSFESLFPETLFCGINADLDDAHATDIEVCFTYYRTPVKRGASSSTIDKVAFKVTYTANSKKETRYYDMSDDPL